MIRLTHDPIDYHALTEEVRRGNCGAVVLFLGTMFAPVKRTNTVS